MEKHGDYDFELHKEEQGWVYDIYHRGYMDAWVESEDYFETEQEARYAAIGHITLLEKGVSND